MAIFNIGEFAYSAEWDLPILIRRARTVRLNLLDSKDLAPPVDKATIGLHWGDEEDDAEANQHASLIITEEDSIEAE